MKCLDEFEIKIVPSGTRYHHLEVNRPIPCAIHTKANTLSTIVSFRLPINLSDNYEIESSSALVHTLKISDG